MGGSVAQRSSGERSVHAAGGKSELDTSVGKALALLEAFQDAGRSVGVTHLAATAGLPKSTAYRLLGILLDWGLVERSGTGYCLGAHLFELGNAIPSCGPSGLREIASPHLMRLYEASHETVHLGVLDGTEVMYVDRLCGRNPPAASRVGVRVPAESAALGKVMLRVLPSRGRRTRADAGPATAVGVHHRRATGVRRALEGDPICRHRVRSGGDVHRCCVRRRPGPRSRWDRRRGGLVGGSDAPLPARRVRGSDAGCHVRDHPRPAGFAMRRRRLE